MVVAVVVLKIPAPDLILFGQNTAKLLVHLLVEYQ
jgi:hypothetical protein